MLMKSAIFGATNFVNVKFECISTIKNNKQKQMQIHPNSKKLV